MSRLQHGRPEKLSATPPITLREGNADAVCRGGRGARPCAPAFAGNIPSIRHPLPSLTPLTSLTSPQRIAVMRGAVAVLSGRTGSHFFKKVRARLGGAKGRRSEAKDHAPCVTALG